MNREIPQSWKLRVLGELMEDVRAGFACGEDVENGIVQIRMNNITREGTFDWGKLRRVPLTYKKMHELLVESGDLLFNCTNSPELVGKCAHFVEFSEPVTFSNHFIRLRPNPVMANSGYLGRWINLLWSHGRFAGMCRQWVNQASISKDQLLDLSLPLPPLPEQRRIAAILDHADAVRAKRRRALALLDGLTQAIFLDMFGDPAINDRQWPIVKISDLLSSTQYGTSKKAGLIGAFPIIRMNNIDYSGRFDFTDLKYIDLERSETDRFLVRNGDILFNRTNSPELVGKTGVFRSSIPMAYAGYLIRLRVNEHADPEYISGFLNSTFGKITLRCMCKSIIGMANINAKEVQTIKIPCPPLPLQRQFSSRAAAVERLKSAQRASLAKLDSLFASLQHRAFRGEL